MKTLIVLFFISLCNSINCFGQKAIDVKYLEILDHCLYVENAQIIMEVYRDNKVIKHYKMDFYRFNDKMRMEFLEPAVEKGRKMLNDATNFWMYLPRTSKVIKLPLKQSFMGSDASNRDLMKISFNDDYEVVNITILEKDMVELELMAKDMTVSYNKVVILLDKGKNVPTKQTMFSLSGKIIRTITYEDIVEIDRVNIPSVMNIKDELQKNTMTKLKYNNMVRKGNKTNDYFTLGALKRY